jgi:hypothetical protein
VPAGAKRPIQLITSKPGNPASATVGSSGAAADRVLPITASARSLPAFTCGSTVGIVAKIIVIWPPSRSVIAGALPL